jgi:hypothetical protein
MPIRQFATPSSDIQSEQFNFTRQPPGIPNTNALIQTALQKTHPGIRKENSFTRKIKENREAFKSY